jgi:asparagine synthase (glutamine-hydrolysing)
MTKFAIPPWISPDFARDCQLWCQARAIMSGLSQYPVEQAFNHLGLRSAVGNWPDWYLAAPLGIHISRPFLDSRVIAYCFSLPREVREVPGVSKPLLQEAMAGILPESIRTRRLKANFNEVYWRGLVQNLPDLEEMVRQSAIDDLGIFDKGKFIEAMRQHALGVGDIRSGSRITSSLAVIAWFDRLPI